MPATEAYWRPLPRMHRIFALSSIVLLASTVWMMVDDHSREWHEYQRQFAKFEVEKLNEAEEAAKPADYDERVAELEQQIQAAAKAEGAAGESLARLRQAVQAAEGRFTLVDRETRFRRAERDVARAEYDIAVRDSLPADVMAARKAKFDAAEKTVLQYEADLEKATLERDAAVKQLAQATAQGDAAKVELQKLRAQVQQIHKAREKLAPSNWFSRAKRKIMEWPIIDGFNSHLRIQQDWIPGLLIDYGGMGKVARFDRCRTCHLGIDRVEAGNAPAFPEKQYGQPYAGHPRLDLYLSATSPHPTQTFGCTVCHEGQGSGTGFSTASHTPNDPGQKFAWEQKYHYEANHFWELPMYPKRFQEAMCLRCHHQVVELAESPKYGPSAPKLVKGYELVKEYGCFGCHEINGWDGDRSIGPDLRPEPMPGTPPTDHPGTLRKVGPSLRHLAQKTTTQWAAYWTEAPFRFRPSTRMPSFFKQAGPDGHLHILEGHDDAEAARLSPVEIAGMAHFLIQKSSPEELLAPAEGYVADAERGKLLFSQRGCLACHSHRDFPEIKADFGPDLSRVGEKVLAGQAGFQWLYTWVREPERHHPQTRMPNLYLEPYVQQDATIDPAADIAAFLAASKLEDKSAADFEMPEYQAQDLEKLVVLLLTKSKELTLAEIEQVVRERKYPRKKLDEVRTDERELFTGDDPGKTITEEMMLNYVGRKTIARYGCYGCHDIPGFETARPIGTALNDWGRKDKSKLAFEHIHEYLHHHGEPDGTSTHKRAEEAARNLRFGEHKDEASREADSALSFFYDQVLHGERAGFIWQKLRAPRSYDYHKTETKGYDERLRMPKFALAPDEIEAVATFVLGLVADPPDTRYLYNPSPRDAARLRGEQVLAKFNCAGCHILDLPKIKYAVDLETLSSTQLAPEDMPAAAELLLALKPPRDGLTKETRTGADGAKRAVIEFHGLIYGRPDPQDEPEDQLYGFDLWETLRLDDKVLFPGERMNVPASDLVSIQPARGGAFAEWLVESLMAQNRETNRYLAWQSSPPPLYLEGVKVQTPWLFKFLKNPYQIRHTTVLRMPRFNMTDEEALALANYFAAVDGAEYPYQEIPQREPDYLAPLERANPNYLADSWKLFNGPMCIKCHQLGGREYKIQDPKTDIRGPNLAHASERLRPDWTLLWIYKPAWITPYTSMPQNFKQNAREFPELFDGEGSVQARAVRDALMNYHRLMESQGRVVYDPMLPGGAAAPGAAGAERQAAEPGGNSQPEPSP